MKINLRHLLCAIEIRNVGTLSAAAEQIHLTQSALTQGINKLEQSIDILLFTRANSGMYCTQNGALFLNRVDRAFTHLRYIGETLFAAGKAKRHSFVRSVSGHQLRALISITELQSYTAAAIHLGLTQPTLHRSIKSLEVLCDQTLFHRSPVGVEPTWRARQIARYASLFYAELTQGLDEVSEAKGRMNGSIRIGSLPLARSEIVPRCVLQLLDEYPLAQVSIIDGSYDEQIHALLHGKLHFIVGALRHPLPHNDVKQETLFSDPLCIVMKANHKFAKRKTLSNEELQNLSWVVPEKGVPTRQVFDDLFTGTDIAPQQIIQCSAMIATRGILLNSDSVALLPAKQIEVELKSGLLALCPMPLKGTSREIGLSVRENWQATRIQKRFIEIIKSHYSLDM